MPRYVAFLRAINVGGRTVKMDRLRMAFEELGFAKVESFIASGNVIFVSRSTSESALVRRIEPQIESTCGFDVTTFLRTDREVDTVVKHDPFPRTWIPSDKALSVAFLANPLRAKQKRMLEELETDADRFHVRGRVVYYLCRTTPNESKVSNALLEKTLKVRCTLRGIGMLKRLAAKYPPAR